MSVRRRVNTLDVVMAFLVLLYGIPLAVACWYFAGSFLGWLNS